jgi:hypothetical protein
VIAVLNVIDAASVEQGLQIDILVSMSRRILSTVGGGVQ